MTYIKIMHIDELYNRLKGMHTVESIQRVLGVSRQMAIYYVHRLRKAGYVRTTGGAGKVRIYRVNRRYALGGISYEDVISRFTPIKLYTGDRLIHGRVPSVEETLVYTLKQGTPRFSLASLWLFNRIDDWQSLYQQARKAQVLPLLVALYDIARLHMRVRRMPARFRTYAKRHIAPMPSSGFRSRSFQDIEDRWQVHIPLNKADIRSVVV